MPYLVRPVQKPITGEIEVPGDKSISHRFLMLASIAKGKSRVENLLTAEDCSATLSAFQKMGVQIEGEGNAFLITGVGKDGLKAPSEPLYLGNSGTSMRLLAGLLCGQAFDATLTGDDSLSCRPMDRVAIPLRKMGAQITGQKDKVFPPISIRGTSLRGISLEETIGSAQVKSALLFAGLFADGKTTVVEKKPSRNHTERMFPLFGIDLDTTDRRLTVSGQAQPIGVSHFRVPGDISSAAFFVVAALIVPDSDLTIKGVNLNPTRAAFLEVLKEMGADISISISEDQFEPVGDIQVKGSTLRGATIPKEKIPFLVDEIPILMVAASFAEGEMVIEEAKELRVKETDRIESMKGGLNVLGANITTEGDTIKVKGVVSLKGGATVQAFGDHRTAMALMVASLRAQSEVMIDDIECIATSYSEFISDFERFVNF